MKKISIWGLVGFFILMGFHDSFAQDAPAKVDSSGGSSGTGSGTTPTTTSGGSKRVNPKGVDATGPKVDLLPPGMTITEVIAIPRFILPSESDSTSKKVGPSKLESLSTKSDSTSKKVGPSKLESVSTTDVLCKDGYVEDSSCNFYKPLSLKSSSADAWQGAYNTDYFNGHTWVHLYKCCNTGRMDFESWMEKEDYESYAEEAVDWIEGTFLIWGDLMDSISASLGCSKAEWTKSCLDKLESEFHTETNSICQEASEGWGEETTYDEDDVESCCAKGGCIWVTNVSTGAHSCSCEADTQETVDNMVDDVMECIEDTTRNKKVSNCVLSYEMLFYTARTYRYEQKCNEEWEEKSISTGFSSGC